MCWYRLIVRTADFHSVNRGSIPRISTITVNYIMIYLTKDIKGNIKLWDVEPDYNCKLKTFYIINIDAVNIDLGIDVTNIEIFKGIANMFEEPILCLEIHNMCSVTNGIGLQCRKININ